MRSTPPWRLIRRRNCPPCERLEEYLRGHFGAEVGCRLEIVDVDSTPHLIRRYGLRVPVLLRGRRVIVEGRWDRERVERALLRSGPVPSGPAHRPEPVK